MIAESTLSLALLDRFDLFVFDDNCSGMSSPTKLLLLQNIYATSPAKCQTLESTSSPLKKRIPSRHKPETSGLSPLRVKNDYLSPKQWKQWVHEAEELNATSSGFLVIRSTESLDHPAYELILNPTATRADEKLALFMDKRAEVLANSTTSILTMKHLPAPAKVQQGRSRMTKFKERKKSARLKVEPLLSDEMRTKLQAHLEEKIKGNIWENEIRSRLARPLSASTFCIRSEQLRHPLSGPQFIERNTPGVPDSPRCPTPRFPYSVEAHEFANCIRRCRLKAWFRAALKTRVRVVAIAIRVFRRRGMPLLIRGFRRRRRAAIRIQQYYRRFRRWCVGVLRPFVCKSVSIWVRQALTLVAARVLIARSITALYLARKLRLADALRRTAHLRRWAAKTRVSLFVHEIWTVRWFRNKRSENVKGMKQELSHFETSDHNIRLEYATIFATPFGKDMLKKELAVWRVGARTRAALEGTPSFSGDTHVDVDPAVFRLRQCFQIFDLDGSGALDLDEFQLMLSYLRGKKQQQPNRGRKMSAQQLPKLSTAQVRNLFAELDQDSNGSITCCELESWWKKEHERTALSTSASTNFLARGLDSLLLQSHGLLFWLLGRKQQLERKFVKKLMVRRAMEKAKRDILHQEIDIERVAGVLSGVFRCRRCGRRFGLRRDLVDHDAHECNSTELMVDTFILKRWIHEEEFRLLEDEKE